MKIQQWQVLIICRYITIINTYRDIRSGSYVVKTPIIQAGNISYISTLINLSIIITIAILLDGNIKNNVFV